MRSRTLTGTSAVSERKLPIFTIIVFFVVVLVLQSQAAEPLPQTANQISGNPSGANGNSVTSLTTSAIPSSAPAGGITITEPQQTAAQSYYKIAQGISVTFGWNFTSVLKYPTSLVVQAFCSENSNTYTLATSLPGTATGFTWAPYDYDQSAALQGSPQLIAATYRLQIMDERGLNIGAQAGLFQPNTKVQFALYQPKPYQPISGTSAER